jgi:hypothetical protein
LLCSSSKKKRILCLSLNHQEVNASLKDLCTFYRNSCIILVTLICWRLIQWLTKNSHNCLPTPSILNVNFSTGRVEYIIKFTSVKRILIVVFVFSRCITGLVSDIASRRLWNAYLCLFIYYLNIRSLSYSYSCMGHLLFEV